MKNAGMAGAVALVGIGLVTIGLSNFQGTPQAQAAPVVAAVEQGPEEPVIVAFGSNVSSRSEGYYRLWSDGRFEVRLIEFNSVENVINCEFSLVRVSGN